MSNEKEEIIIPIYKEKINVYINDEMKSNGRVEARWDRDSLIVIILELNSNVGASTIAHEALHIIDVLFLYKGVRWDSGNIEPQCYLLGWLVDEITNRFIKLKEFKEDK